MVLLGRIELPASPLPRVRSTTELQQHIHRERRALQCPAPLSSVRSHGKDIAMSGTSEKPTREERLAAKLRENLRRRKARSRATGSQSGDGVAQPPQNAPLPNGGADR